MYITVLLTSTLQRISWENNFWNKYKQVVYEEYDAVINCRVDKVNADTEDG